MSEQIIFQNVFKLAVDAQFKSPFTYEHHTLNKNYVSHERGYIFSYYAQHSQQHPHKNVWPHSVETLLCRSSSSREGGVIPRVVREVSLSVTEVTRSRRYLTRCSVVAVPVACVQPPPSAASPGPS